MYCYSTMFFLNVFQIIIFIIKNQLHFRFYAHGDDRDTKVLNVEDIDDLEGQVKRIIDYLELPFEKECISFYNTKRSVRTASSEQVRKPINKDGVERWKPYSKKLKPLVDCLGEELLKPEDIALIN